MRRLPFCHPHLSSEQVPGESCHHAIETLFKLFFLYYKQSTISSNNSVKYLDVTVKLVNCRIYWKKNSY